jgi:hypothetical protein
MLIYVKSPYKQHTLILGKIQEITYTFGKAYPWRIKVVCQENSGLEINVGSIITCVSLRALSFIRLRKEKTWNVRSL